MCSFTEQHCNDNSTFYILPDGIGWVFSFKHCQAQKDDGDLSNMWHAKSLSNISSNRRRVHNGSNPRWNLANVGASAPRELCSAEWNVLCGLHCRDDNHIASVGLIDPDRLPFFI